MKPQRQKPQRLSARGLAHSPAQAPNPPGQLSFVLPHKQKAGEVDNWYSLPMESRKELMHRHGMIGRSYAGQVVQMITGSVGFDDWEWGVTLFSDDPLSFKRLVYEMRFDEASAKYGLFGPFWVGVRLDPDGLAAYLSGSLPR